MKLANRIIDYILRVKKPVTLDQLVAKSTATGFSELDVLTALEHVHKDKRVQVRNLANGVTYSPAVSKPKTTQTHITWIRQNYPPMNSTNDGSGIDVGDLSWMFLKTKEERDAFKAEMSGKPVGYAKSRCYNKRYGRQGK